MNKYDAGNIRIILFDEVGGKIREFSYENDLFIDAQGKGEELVASGEATSFVISRIIFNSAKQRRKWETKE